MPVHDLGYRPWGGKRVSRILRPLVIARSGISLVWRRRWLRMMIVFSWLPLLIFGAGIFVFEYSGNNAEWRGPIMNMFRRMDRMDLAIAMASDHASVRHDAWATMILTFFRVPQLLAMVMLVGLIAPMLISYDLRSKAYLMYFSRPLSPLEYIVGKSAVLWFFLSMITAVPALLLYVVGVFLSPDFSVIAQTWDIPLRILAATVALIVPTTVLALCYSSFTSESRYATFAWISTWVMGSVAYRFLTFAGSAPQARRFPGRRGPGPRNFEDWGPEQWEQFARERIDTTDYDKWRLVSPYDTLGKVESWLFGLDATPGSVTPAIIMLVAITVVGALIIRHRIKARLTV